jgi:hypothetical protein
LELSTVKRRSFINSLSAISLLPILGKYAQTQASPKGSTGATVPTTVKNVTPRTSALGSSLLIGSGKQLFIDDYLIATRNNVVLTVNPPRKTGEFNVVSEHPWEDFRVGAWHTVVEDDGIHKMWYEGTCDIDSLSKKRSASGLGRLLCYATSTDGIHWQKPMLGLVEYEGSKTNNIVIRDSTGTVFLDPNKTGGNRFKYVGWWHGDGRGFNETRVWIFTSADGTRWRPLGNDPIMAARRQFDTQNQIFWDERIGKYVAYVRHNDFIQNERGQRDAVRKTHRAETSDLSRWPSTSLVFAPDASDPIVSDHYNICAIKYPFAPNIYFGFPSAYYHLNRNGRRNEGPLDIQLVTSRDGIQWHRPERRPYLRLGVDGSPDCGNIYMGIGMFRKGHELWMYYSGYDFTHGGFDRQTTRKKGIISRIVQRMDGFMSADAAYTGGELRTRPLRFTGNKLVLNVDTGALGFIRVELLDKDAKPIPGYTEQECDLVNGNFINREITWNGKADVNALIGQTVHLRFAMRSTKLYAFQFDV